MEGTKLEEKVLQVPSRNQIAENIVEFGATRGTPRIMFLGNSVTLHSPKKDIGWFGNWGMAASAQEKDYVHLIMAGIREKYPDAAFCIAQGAVWETTLEQCDYEKYFSPARAFGADIILSTLEANIPEDTFDAEVFCKEIGLLHQYLMQPGKKTSLIIASSMCQVPEKDAAIEAYAKQVHARYVFVGDIFKDPRNLAIGLFAHDGVAHHPSDLGMEKLAERYLTAINQVISDTEQ